MQHIAEGSPGDRGALFMSVGRVTPTRPVTWTTARPQAHPAAMPGIDVNLQSDICDQVAAFQEAFLSETSLNRFRRACAFTASEAAKAAAQGASRAVDQAFSDPTPWMRKAFTYKRALTRTGDIVEAEVGVLPSQSIVMKYAMGKPPGPTPR